MSPNVTGFLFGCTLMGITSIALLLKIPSTDQQPLLQGAHPGALHSVEDTRASKERKLASTSMLNANLEEPAATPSAQSELTDAAITTPVQTDTNMLPALAADKATTTPESTQVPQAPYKESTSVPNLPDQPTAQSQIARTEQSTTLIDLAVQEKPTARTDATIRTERFWGPFNAELRATAFAQHLSKLVDHKMLIEPDENGYHIAFQYTSDDQRQNLRSRITDVGLELH